MSDTNTHDADRGKGAVEPEDRQSGGNTSLQGQLPHRSQDPLIKSADTDFPEPGENPEHSGEPQEPSTLSRDTQIACTKEERPPKSDEEKRDNPDHVGINQDPGARQKKNQGQ
jgi:hypothetical protein